MSKKRKDVILALLVAWHCAFGASLQTTAEACRVATLDRVDTDRHLRDAVRAISTKGAQYSAGHVAAALRAAMGKTWPWKTHRFVVTQKRMYSSSGNRMASMWAVEAI